MAYATFSEFIAFGVNQRAVDSRDRAAIEGLIDSVSEEFDSYANPQHKTPFLTGSKSLPAVKRSICAVVTYEYLANRGFDPAADNEVIVERAKQAREWWKQIALGRVRLDVVDQTPTEREGGAVVISRPSKWA